MRKVKYVNSSGGELELTNSAPFLLQKFEESENVNINNSKGVNQDGLTYLGNTLDSKDIMMEFIIIADSEPSLIKYRDMLRKVFNPKLGEGYVIYTDDVKEQTIKCIITAIPVFSDVRGHHGITGKVCTGMVSLIANNPFWTELLETRTEIALWTPDFRFPLTIKRTGIIFGHREPSVIVNLNNSGDVESGMRIEFKALATLTNPSLLNTITGEFIKMNKTMVSGEIITVSTYFRNKKITSTLNDLVTNAFNYIDFESTFLQLSVGDNLFKYNADTGVDNLEVRIYYKPQYLGV